MGRALIFLAFSIITFVIVFSILFQFMPIILGAVASALQTVIDLNTINAEWLLIYDEVGEIQQLIIPLVMTLGVVLIVLKVLMAATNRGNE